MMRASRIISTHDRHKLRRLQNLVVVVEKLGIIEPGRLLVMARS
jgi:hypothetical protein